ncbi:30S ribosomal protein S12 methylthiotransferase RimO [Marinihelvus fidelis]|uniref:Ribosomal protein uS12 methylthiotransferase RimO n=1 Tax=Marinihelvus fidelis TaxID=2613842 RepID=A0A5N0TCX5_9GAMM|nr:30S ribosomal protein S12 methylthiotransferase RimO [Marinihelvus fidelis]KAA9131917.1 30S ribosomal protein S12 methylthiotransferase RimO [Marinihelvus fidelis]
MDNTQRKVGFVSLGCPKALVDSERIITQLKMDGYGISPSYEDADIVVVNTCGFIDAARAESLEAIGEALDANGRVLVTGCLGAEAGTIRDIHPKVLDVSGPQQYEQVVDAVHRHVPIPRHHDPFQDLVPPQGIRLTPRHYAYLKISEGCNHHCTFCIIPSMRGRLASRPAGDVMGEAERLVESGVRELLVISQDTSAYGSDLKYRTDFWNGRPVRSRLTELCTALGSLGAWVRLHYVYPYPHVDELIPLMADGVILPYLDIPLQHGSPSVLKAMRRPAAADRTLDRIHRWRQACPDIALRSTFIVGFPGETDEDFELLLDFIDEAQLDRVGCFRYSPVEGATANGLADPVPDAVMHEREAVFMARQAEISAQRLKARVGKTLQVLVDEADGATAIARSHADAPEIDGLVHINGASGISAGDMLDVHVTDADQHDLFAVPTGG